MNDHYLPYRDTIRAIEVTATANIAHLVCGHKKEYNLENLPKIGERCRCEECDEHR